MINQAGDEYSHADFERQKATDLNSPDASHYRWRELQLATAFDLLHRLLKASRREGKDVVDEFMEDFEDFLKRSLGNTLNLKTLSMASAGEPK
jgi:hypothetical protein